MTIGKQVSQLSGELVAAPPETLEVPYAPGFNLDALRAVDPEPVFATVKIKPGKGNGGKGPNYSPEILKNLAAQFIEKRPSGYRGHQDPDKVAYEWRDPVTSWVGARYDENEGVLYVKGYVPPTAADLRAQLALATTGADIVNSVSIWGMREVKNDEVTDFDLWSLDWTPKGRNGMETELVSVGGEQKEEETVDREQVIASLRVDELPDRLVEAIRADDRGQLEQLNGIVGEMRVVLELEESADAAQVLDSLRTLISERQASDFEDRIETQVNEEVAGELMQTAIRERVVARLSVDATDEEIAGEIAAAKELPHIKALAGSKVPTVVGGAPEHSTKGERKGTAWI